MTEKIMEQKENHTVFTIFPTPVYKTNWKTENSEDLLKSWEMTQKDIRDILKEELREFSDRTGPRLDYRSENCYLFDDRLKKLKEFIELHIKQYVKKIWNPKEDLDFYISTSWLNVIKPGGSIHLHSHSNSIISGSFYAKTVEEDRVSFHDPNLKRRLSNSCIEITSSVQSQEPVMPYSETVQMVDIGVNDYDLLLFPSWLEHSVTPNEMATQDRFSISFNVFARGMFGDSNSLSRLKI